METIKSMYKEMAQNYLSTKVREACCRVFWRCRSMLGQGDGVFGSAFDWSISRFFAF